MSCKGWIGWFVTAMVMAAFAAMLGSCAPKSTLPNVPDIQIVKVDIPVPVKCPVIVPGTPDWVDADGKRISFPDVGVAANAADAGRTQRDNFIEDLRDLLEACVK